MEDDDCFVRVFNEPSDGPVVNFRQVQALENLLNRGIGNVKLRPNPLNLAEVTTERPFKYRYKSGRKPQWKSLVETGKSVRTSKGGIDWFFWF